jgi:hypothetical protein
VVQAGLTKNVFVMEYVWITDTPPRDCLYQQSRHSTDEASNIRDSTCWGSCVNKAWRPGNDQSGRVCKHQGYGLKVAEMAIRKKRHHNDPLYMLFW